MVVLVVDDDAMILRATEAILRRGGYSPTSASGPIEALRKSRGFRGEIHLLLTDVMMPGMNGPTLARRIIAERPLIRVLLISAGTNVSSRMPLLKKPFSMDELLARVAQVIEGPPAASTRRCRRSSRQGENSQPI
jgi:DNA-binding response OmpR family regulator